MVYTILTREWERELQTIDANCNSKSIDECPCPTLSLMDGQTVNPIHMTYCWWWWKKESDKESVHSQGFAITLYYWLHIPPSVHLQTNIPTFCGKRTAVQGSGTIHQSPRDIAACE
jgi:hypothetical protein